MATQNKPASSQYAFDPMFDPIFERETVERAARIRSAHNVPPAQVLTHAELQHDAFKIPINTLLDMWLTRFGNDWVDVEELNNDRFFDIAYQRLRSMGKLESHYLTDRARYVCRKPE